LRLAAALAALLLSVTAPGQPGARSPDAAPAPAVRATQATPVGPQVAQAIDPAQVQALLAKRGYNVGKVDGMWGPRSQRALDAFRAEAGESRSGPPTEADVARLTGQAQGGNPAAAPSASESLELFGNTFAISGTAPESGGPGWDKLRPHLFTSLPGWDSGTLSVSELRALIYEALARKRAEFDEHVSAIRVLLRPQIRAQAAATAAPDQVDGIVAGYRTEIADAFRHGEGQALFDRLGAGPGFAELIQRTETIALETLALEAAAGSMKDIRPRAGGADAPAPAPTTETTPTPRAEGTAQSPARQPAAAAGVAVRGAAQNDLPYFRVADCTGERGLMVMTQSTIVPYAEELQLSDICFDEAAGTLTYSESVTGLRISRNSGGHTAYEALDEAGKRRSIVFGLDPAMSLSTGESMSRLGVRTGQFGSFGDQSRPDPSFRQTLSNTLILGGAGFEGVVADGEYTVAAEVQILPKISDAPAGAYRPQDSDLFGIAPAGGPLSAVGGRIEGTLEVSPTGAIAGGTLWLSLAKDGDWVGAADFRAASSRVVSHGTDDWTEVATVRAPLIGRVIGDSGQEFYFVGAHEAEVTLADGRNGTAWIVLSAIAHRKP